MSPLVSWIQRRAVSIVLVSVALLVVSGWWRDATRMPDSQRADLLRRRWVEDYDRRQLATRTPIVMGYVKGWSPKFTKAGGMVEVNFATGQVRASVRDLPPLSIGARYDLWLVDNVPGPANTVLIDQGPNGDTIQDLGTFDAEGGLTGMLDVSRLDAFDTDLAAVMRVAPGKPAEFVVGGLQSVYYQMNRRAWLARGKRPADSGIRTAGLAPTALFGQVSAGGGDDLAQLISFGEQLFNNETFGGNGRTCATCHPASNAFTIDPDFIRKLPSTDPLFVFERVPALAGLEDRKLLRGPRALVLENIAGFDAPPVFRGTPGLFNLGPTPPFGLSRAADDLQAFSFGAIVQHAPRRIGPHGRVPGIDFRVPTAEELAAMEAFMLSVSFPDATPELSDFDLSDPAVQRGQELFFGSKARCSGCHKLPVLGNPSFTSDTPFAGFFNTGVSQQGINNSLPVDLGVGFQTNDPALMGRFDTPQLFGIALTPPFFHDNSAATLQESVKFYRTKHFVDAGAPNRQPIDLTGAEVHDIVAFLEAISE